MREFGVMAKNILGKEKNMKTAHRYTRRARRGLVLPLAAAIALILAVLGIGLLQLGYGARVIAAVDNAEISARTAADAGVTHALYAMNAAIDFGELFGTFTPPPNVVYPPGISLPNSYTTFSYDIVQRSDALHGGTYWEIISTGRVNRADRRTKIVHAITRRQSAWHGVGVKESFTDFSGALFESFPPGSVFEGSVRTNSTDKFDITLHSGTRIPGDVTVGPGGDTGYVIKTPSGGAQIDGSTTVAEESLSFPDVVLPPAAEVPGGTWTPGPALPAAAQYLETGEVDPVTLLPIRRAVITSGLPGAAYVYTNLTIPNLGGGALWELRLVGTFVINVTRDMLVQNGARLTIGDPGDAIADTLELYLGASDPSAAYASLIAQNGASILTMPRPADPVPHSVDLKIYGLPSCTTNGKVNPAITINNSGQFWGVIYAPDAPLRILNSGSMYGSFVGYSLSVYNSGAFYYDTRIPYEQVPEPWYFEIERWWEETGSPPGP